MYYLDEGDLNIEFKTEPFDSALWSIVRKAGSFPLADTMREAIENLDEEKIKIIFENITHQMSFYSAAYIVIPHMVKLLENIVDKENSNLVFELIFNMGICLATDIEGNRYEDVDSPIMDEYNAAVQKLAVLTKHYINKYIDEIRKMDEQKRNMLLTAVIAIFGERETAFSLVLSCWDIEEICMMCGGDCEYFNETFSPFEDDDGEIELAEYTTGQWDGKSYNDAFVWICAIAEMFGSKHEIEVLSYIYGKFTCPECKETKKVIDYMITYYTES